MSNFFYGTLPISQITTTTGSNLSAPGYSGFPVVPTSYSGLQPNDFYYYYTDPTNGKQPVSSLCTAVISPVNPNYNNPAGKHLIPPAGCKSISFYAVSGGGGGGGGGGYGQVSLTAAGKGTSDGGNGGNGAPGNYLWVYGAPADNITYSLGKGGNGGFPGDNENTTTTAGQNGIIAEGGHGGAGGHGNVTTVTIGETTYSSGSANAPANAGGNGGGGGGGGYMLQNTVYKFPNVETEFYPSPGSPGNSGNTPTQYNSPSPINVNFPPLPSNYGAGGNGGALGQDNGGPNAGNAGNPGAVQFIWLYD
jgi:hypothetical protein